MDLIGEGNIGLIQAVDRFNVNKGCHFISYGVWWIRQSILKAIGERSRLIRIPQNRAAELARIERECRDLAIDLSTSAEIGAIARRLEMDRDHLFELINLARRDLISLETPVYSETHSTLVDFVEDTANPPPDEAVIRSAFRDDILNALESLSLREADILRSRFGLTGDRPESLKQIGKRYRLTKERIRQIEKKALMKLRRPSTSHSLEHYLS